MTHIWAGIDAGKGHHHCVAIDDTGKRLLSRRVPNDEQDLVQLLTDVLALGDEVTWGIDLLDGGAPLMITLLVNHGQQVLYIPGRTVNRASEGYRGAGKTDAKDAAIIADQARIRRDLTPLRANDQLIAELKLLTGHRQDLVEDRTRLVNRLRGHLTEIFPGLERVLDLTNIGPLVLLSTFQTPRSLRRFDVDQLADWLRERKVRRARQIAAAAVEAAERQHTIVPGENVVADMVRSVAQQVLSLTARIAEIDELIVQRFRDHKDAEVIVSMPGIGPLLGAEFLAATGGDMSAFGTPDRLAAFAGVAPVPRDSGKISGNLHRPQRYNRLLQRVFYTSALVSIRCCDESRRFYDRKRTEGKRHSQAVMALARRRVNVLWALIRDGRCYAVEPPIKIAA